MPRWWRTSVGVFSIRTAALIARNLPQSRLMHDGPRVEELNRLVHPAVIQEQDGWSEQIGRQDPQAVTIVEAALISKQICADILTGS